MSNLRTKTFADRRFWLIVIIVHAIEKRKRKVTIKSLTYILTSKPRFADSAATGGYVEERREALHC